MDFRHLLGGMMGGVALLAAYIIGWGMLQSCGGMVVTRPAGDGANTVTYEVDGQGYIRGATTTLAYVPPKYIPRSGDKVIVEDYEYIMISVEEWARITNAVARLEMVAERRWVNEHKTEAGRRAWHGEVKERKQMEDGRGWVYTYADGYTYEERTEPRRRASPAVRKMQQNAAKPAATAKVPRALKAKQEALAARPKAKEVNATFGPGGKVLKVEEGK